MTRDGKIQSMRKAGISLKDIGIAFDISSERVRQITVDINEQLRRSKQVKRLQLKRKRIVRVEFKNKQFDTILKCEDLNRNDKIRAMRKAGISSVKIGKAFGITGSHVRWIVRNENEKRNKKYLQELNENQQERLLNKLTRYWHALPSDLQNRFLQITNGEG